MSINNSIMHYLALRYDIGRLGLKDWGLWKVPTHPPLHSNEEDIEGLGLWKEEVQALHKALKSQLSLSPPTLIGTCHQWTIPSGIGYIWWLSLAKPTLKVALASRNHSLVTHFTHKTESPWPLHFKHSHWWKRRSRSKFASHYAWGTNGVCECKMDVKSTWIPTWHQMDHVSWSLGLFSKTTSWR